MQVVLNKKSTKEITLFPVGWCLNTFVFFFSFKNYALKNIAIYVMCNFTKNTTTNKVKEWIIYFFKIINLVNLDIVVAALELFSTSVAVFLSEHNGSNCH